METGQTSRGDSHAPWRRQAGGWAFLSFLVVSCVAQPVVAQDASAVICSKCHGDLSFLSRLAPRDVALHVTDSLLQDGAHRSLQCLDCHPGLDVGFPHPASTPVACATCHAAPSVDWEASIHAADEAAGDAATCLSCHGSPHNTYAAEDRRAPTHPLNVATTCGQCHGDPRIIGTYFSTPEEAQARNAVRDYHQTVHGTALSAAGLTVSATCNDCHESHRVLPADSATSSVNRRNVAQTCGACHLGILEVYESGSAHESAYRSGAHTQQGLDAPACVDCHSAHQIVRVNETEWLLGMSTKCGTCHAELWQTYLRTYHGQVTNLGFGLTAKCSDCHTAHNMRPASDLASTIHPSNLVATCSQCHQGVSAQYVKYYAHGDPRDRRRYPILYWPWLFMTTLLVSVWSFFALHSLLWFNGLRLERRRRSGANRPAGES